MGLGWAWREREPGMLVWCRRKKDSCWCGADDNECMLVNLCRFNKTEHDFDGLDAYNNYLEEVEDISMLLLEAGRLVHFVRLARNACMLWIVCLLA
jgi:hypothetical protein